MKNIPILEFANGLTIKGNRNIYITITKEKNVSIKNDKGLNLILSISMWESFYFIKF
jgi:hypothetical protein